MHDRCALRKSGAAGSRPGLPNAKPNAPLDAEGGSGKFGTPCERMHLENSSPATSDWARCAGLGAKPPNLTPPPRVLGEATRPSDLLELEMLATVRLASLPQPAARIATVTSATSAPEAPRKRHGRRRRRSLADAPVAGEKTRSPAQRRAADRAS